MQFILFLRLFKTKFIVGKLIERCAEVTTELEYIENKLRRQWHLGKYG